MKKPKIRNRLRKLWKEWRLTILFIIFVIIPVKSTLADWNWVPTGSMKPTILEGDLLFVNKAAYDLRIPLTLFRIAKWADPQRGDIVICFSPEDGTRLVKRVVALPGDRIEMRDNNVFLNEKKLDYLQIEQRYVNSLPDELKGKYILKMEDLDGIIHPVMSNPSIGAKRSFSCITVPENSYFVMGDNRDVSKDSRYFGFVQRKQIVGKAKRIILSFDTGNGFFPRFGRFFTPVK
jgi:signal peptidase I